jgi:hypothetical protein
VCGDGCIAGGDVVTDAEYLESQELRLAILRFDDRCVRGYLSTLLGMLMLREP